MAHKTVILKASELIEDFAIYPRNCVFDGHVYDLAEPIRAGAALPPCVADAKTKRLTDGFHRRRAFIRVHGDEAEVEVMLVDFANDAEMVLDAVSRNSHHGRRLTSADIARCAVLAKQFRISRERIAEALHVTREKVAELVATRCAAGKDGTVILRRPMAHLAGTKLSKAQESVVEHVGGQTARYHAECLIKLIESKSLPDDDKLWDRLKCLHEILEGLLVS